MGILSKLKFWKRKKQEAEDLELEQEQNIPQQPNYPAQNYPQFGRREQGMQQQISAVESDDREFQILSSKIDVLNAKLDAISQRLINLERLAEQEPEQKW